MEDNTLTVYVKRLRKSWGMLFRFQQSGGSDIVWISKKEILELSEGIQKAIEGESFDPRDEKEGPWSILK